MKRIALLVFAAVAALGLAGRAAAQDAFAPLVQKETVSIARIDLNKIDAKTLQSQLVKVAEAGIDYFVADVDAEQADAAKKAVPMIGAVATQYFSLFVDPFKDAGVSEAFVVVDQSVDPENPLYPYLAIPTAGMTDEQVKDVRAALATLNKNVDGALKYRFVRNGFVYAVFIPATVDEADAKEYVKKRFAKTTSVDATPFVEGFKLAGNDAVFSGAGIAVDAALNFDEQLKTLDQLGDGETADAIKAFGEEMFAVQADIVKLTKYNAWKLDLTNLEFVSYLQTNSDAEAQEYVALIAGVKKEVAAFIDEILASAIEDADKDVDPAQLDAAVDGIVAICNAFFDAVKADGATIKMTVDEKFFVDNEAVFKGFVKTIQEIAAAQAEANAQAEIEEGADAADLDQESL